MIPNVLAIHELLQCMHVFLDLVGSIDFAVCFQQLVGTLVRAQLTNSRFHRNLELFQCDFNGFLKLSVIRVDRVGYLSTFAHY